MPFERRLLSCRKIAFAAAIQAKAAGMGDCFFDTVSVLWIFPPRGCNPSFAKYPVVAQRRRAALARHPSRASHPLVQHRISANRVYGRKRPFHRHGCGYHRTDRKPTGCHISQNPFKRMERTPARPGKRRLCHCPYHRPNQRTRAFRVFHQTLCHRSRSHHYPKYLF